MPCLRANFSARPRSRAATATTVAWSGIAAAGFITAVGRDPRRAEDSDPERVPPQSLDRRSLDVRPRCMPVLHGIRVVDLSTEIAGPVLHEAARRRRRRRRQGRAGRRRPAAPLGPSAADGHDGALFEFLNTVEALGRRHRSPTPAIVDLCVVADVVVHDAPPGTFPVDPLLERNPALVVVSISPFGQDGPVGRPRRHRVHAAGVLRLDRLPRPPRAAARSPPAAASASG